MQIAKMLMNTYNQHDRLMRINELINQQPVAHADRRRRLLCQPAKRRDVLKDSD